jgi:NADH-quinone oxidoreductase subunit F
MYLLTFLHQNQVQQIAGEVRVCLCSSCSASGSQKIYKELQNQITKHNLIIKLKNVGCTGIAYQTPLLEIVMADGKTFHYGKVQEQDIQNILLRHFHSGSLLKRGSAAINSLLEKLYSDEAQRPVTRYSIDIRNGIDAQYKVPQYHLVTEHCGHLNPLKIDEYIENDGFSALKKCLTELTPEAIINQVEESGLRGRGGGGFPTATKWFAVSYQENDTKYLICNGDEGDPGAFMDRMILESFPYRVIEGMIIASFVLGAKEGIFYIRAEYPLALQNIKAAIKICEERGILGNNIMGTDHSFSLRVVAGAGAFVCGEETALISAIEGKRGMPRLRPPYPAVKGLWEKPTLVQKLLH